MTHHLPPPFEACSLDEPFIFVSYSHKDTALVFPELEALHKQGYRIWYDEGIDPGNEWPEEIANALMACGYFVVFISPNAVNSKNVKNEINFALNNNKAFLAIHLEETHLPAGLQLRMGDIQAVLKYRMTDEAYRRKLAKILPDELVNKEGLDVAEETEKPEKPIIQTPAIIVPQPKDPNTLTDIDGNVYKTVKIGNQIWTAENLKVTKLNDGTPILNLEDDESWASIELPAFCFYDNDPANKEKFGALYNFFAVDTGLLAPKGWHVPTDEEWEILIKSLGGEDKAGKLLKAKTGWEDNGNGTDAVGFSALPGGNRWEFNGHFLLIGEDGFWWSASARGINAGYIAINNLNANIERDNGSKVYGSSVRLVLD